MTSNPGSHVVIGIGLWPLECWDNEVESCCRHECSSAVFVVCCAGSDVCIGTITYPGESYRVCACTRVYVYLCVIQQPQQYSGLGPSWAVVPRKL